MIRMNDALLMTASIRKRLDAEAEETGGNWWVCIEMADGRVLTRQSHVLAFPPSAEQHAWAEQITSSLNRHIDHDGAWLCAWRGPQWQGGMLIWIDQDGDPQFTIELDDPVWMIVATAADKWIGDAEAAWCHWHHLMRTVLKPAEGQTYKRAQGQEPSITT